MKLLGFYEEKPYVFDVPIDIALSCKRTPFRADTDSSYPSKEYCEKKQELRPFFLYEEDDKYAAEV